MKSNIASAGRLLLICCMCTLWSCKDKAASVADGKIVLAESESVAEIRYDDDRFIESWSMVELEVGENSLIGEITQLKLFEGKIYIADRKSNSLAIFHLDGSFSHKIGAQGRGPQEYLALCAFYINPDKRQITLFDAMLTRRALIFDLDGKFVGTKDIPQEIVTQSLSNIEYFGNGMLVCYANPTGLCEDVLFVLNEDDFSIVDKLATRPMELGQSIYAMSIQPYSIVDGKLRYIKWFDNNIYEWSRNGSKPLFEVDTGKPPVPEGILETVAASNSGDYFGTVNQLVQEGKYSVGLRELYETSRFIFCEFRNEGLGLNLLVWDKKQKKSFYLNDRPVSMTPDIKNIVFSSEDRMVCYWPYYFIKNFQNRLENGKDVSTIDPRIVETLKNYDALSDNPLLFIYDIKK